MKKITLLLAYLACITPLLIAQSPTLVQDYILGPQGSVDNRIYNFLDVLTYEGTTQNGEHAILQYDRYTEEITVLATNEDFEGDIINITSNTEEMIVFTGEGSSIKNLYRSVQSDFSDLQKIYGAGDAILRNFRSYEDHTLILEENYDGVNYSTTIKVVDLDGNIDELFSDLPGRPFDYTYTGIRGHFIIAPEVELIDEKSIIAYNIESKSFVPFTDIIPDFEDCGLISQVAGILETALYYKCDKEYVYDLEANQYIDFEGSSIFIVNVNEEFIYFTAGGTLYKTNKSTGEQEIVIDQIIRSRAFFSSYVCFSADGDKVNATYIDFEEEKMYTYPTDYTTDIAYRFTGFGVVPDGVHLVVYRSDSDDGVIVRINPDSFTEIDSVFNVNFANRPVAYNEDIYFTHQDAEVGNELFLIDYELTSTKEVVDFWSVNISPNPAQSFINIDYPADLNPVSSSIYDINGQLVQSLFDQNQVNTSDLKSGLYFLKVVFENGEIGTRQFIIE